MTPTEAKEELRKLMQSNVLAGVNSAYPGQAQLPFGQPMLSSAIYNGPTQTEPGRTVRIDAGNVVIKKVRNGYLIHVHTTAYSEPTIYVCGDAEDVGEALKVALVNLRIDAAK